MAEREETKDENSSTDAKVNIENIPNKDKDAKENPPAALIVTERWGLSMIGGIPACLYRLIYLLKSVGLAIYCTILEVDGKTEKEAERLGVYLLSPTRKRHYETEKPSSIWLAGHPVFFPQIKKVPNVRFIFGFGLVTSSTALDIKESVFPKALYCLVNVWNPDTLNSETFKCDKETFAKRCKLLDEENLCADIVISVGYQTFEYFKFRFQNPNIKHFKLLPMPCQMFYAVPIPRPEFLPQKVRQFQILSYFDQSVVADLSNNDPLLNAMNLMASAFDKVYGESPKWRIICFRSGDDVAIHSALNAHSTLPVSLKRVMSIEDFSNELRSSHFLILPQRDIDSFKVAVSAMASGKPIIVPRLSECDELIQEHLLEYRDDMVVDMRKGPEALEEKIIDIVQSYTVYLKKASRIRDKIQKRQAEHPDIVHENLLKEITDSLNPRGSTESSAECTSSDKSRTQGNYRSVSLSMQDGSYNVQAQSVRVRTSEETRRLPGTVGVHIGTLHGQGLNGTPMSAVEAAFYQVEGDRPINEGLGRLLTDIHFDVEAQKIERSSLRYVMKCGSLEALEALWSEYISERLDKTIHSTIITPTLLRKIQAHYLTLDIYIPVQEYLLCKREIPLLTGSVPTPSRRRSVAAITELKSAPREDIIRHHTVDSLNLLLSRMQIRDNQTISELLSRDDFSVEELQGHRLTFVTKQWKVRPDVYFKEAKFGQSQSTKERHIMTLKNEASSVYKVEDEFVQLKIHASKHSATSKAVLHEAGQKLVIQSEDITNQAIPVKEKFEAGKAEFEKMQSDAERVNQGYSVKESILEVFGKGSMPGQFDVAEGIHIKNNGQWVICDWGNHRVQVIDPIKLCCDLILQFHAFPNPFYPEDVTVDEDNDQYFMSDHFNGQVVVSSGQSKILNSFGGKEGIHPRGICLSPDGFIFIGDWKGYVRKYNKSGEHIARTEEGQVRKPLGLIVNKKWIFVSDNAIGRKCVHVLNHQMQSIRDIGKGHLEYPVDLCFDHQQDGIYVCDFSANRVVHFNCDGEFLSYKGKGQLEKPRFIALCKDNPYRLVVTQEYCIKLLYI